MTISDKIQLLGIIVSTITSLIAIWISVKTMRQNSKMLEESSRPYIGIYGVSTHIHQSVYYIIIKNFGQSAARIDSLTYDFDLAKLSLANGHDPFAFIDDATLMPGQSYRCAIKFQKILDNKLSLLHFYVKYSSGTHHYEDDISLKLNANLENFETHQVPNKTIDADHIIAETLQDMHIKSL